MFVLNGIKGQIQDVNNKLDIIEKDLHKRVSEVDRRHEDRLVDIDRRLVKVESRCDMHHQENV